MWNGIFSLIGTGISTFFGFKKEQANVINGAMKVLGDANASNAQREQAIAQIISAEAGSGYWLSAVWRPLAMVIFLILLVAYWFGFVPPNLEGPMPEGVKEIFGLIKLGLGGYIGGRTLEKIVNNIGIAGVLKKFIEKKLG